MAHVDPETLEALNALLQDERASVEVEVALSNGATERAEREALVDMGIVEVGFCCSLHEYLAASGAFVTRHVNGIVLNIISTEHYDDRLRAFAMHQAGTGERAHQLGTIVSDDELRQLLGEIYDVHLRSALWSEYRANQFARSRTLEFRTGTDSEESTRDSTESTLQAVPSLPDTPLIRSKEPESLDPIEDEANWSGDNYRSPAAQEGYRLDDE